MRRRYTASQARLRVTELAARYMAEDGLASYHRAKKKAAHRLGMKGRYNLPDNREIEAVLSQYQRLFQSETQGEHLYKKRQTALATMRFLADFSPRLVGPVLSGTAGEYSVVDLHIFTDTMEEVGLVLSEYGIPYEIGQRALRQDAKSVVRYPCYKFIAGEVTVELVVFPYKEIRRPPLSPVDNRPMRRADRATVEALMAATTAAIASAQGSPTPDP
jgi:hypothetical protein